MVGGTYIPSSAQLKQARAMLGWTQKQLADCAGLSRGAVNVIETSPNADPRWSSLIAIKQSLEDLGIVFPVDGSPVFVNSNAPNFDPDNFPFVVQAREAQQDDALFQAYRKLQQGPAEDDEVLPSKGGKLSNR